METKATRLEGLHALVEVPPFIRISRADIFSLSSVPAWDIFIVRSIHKEEDQKKSSHAGQFLSIGPISRDEVADAVKRVFHDDSISEVIIQEYKKGISGVAFCFSEDYCYVEYSNCSEGVTAGKVRPFVALLSNENPPQYRKLQAELLKIYRHFGPSDVEFIGIDDPVFVQTRPITSNFEVDCEMVRLQMRLQESLSGKWIENDVAQVIGEHASCDSNFVFYYMEAITSIFRRYFTREIDVSLSDVINVGSQYFVSERYVTSTTLGRFDLLRFAIIFFKEQEILKDLDKGGSLTELFEKSILSSMAYTFLKKKEFFDIREKYRQMIDALLVTHDCTEGKILRFPYSGYLDSVIELNRDLNTWISLGKRGGRGIQVASGRFDRTKFFRYQEGRAIPSGAVVLCDYLYPEIGRSIDTIQGVICANGSINSHVAILCRERNIPLVIQANLDRYR